MSSNSPSHSQEFNIDSNQQQSLVENPVVTESNPLPDLDQENPPEKEEDFEAVEADLVNPGMTNSHSFVPAEVSVGPTVSSASDGMLTSPTSSSRRTHLRKKSKSRWPVLKQKAIDKKLQTLLGRLNLVPFVSSKSLDFDKHELLLKRLGLWDFVNIGLGSDFNNFHTDLVAQLLATYDAKSKTKCGYVNDVRIKVSRADLARAFKLPLKKEKTGNMLASDVGELDATVVSEDSLAFLEHFLASWMILNNDEELWIMPDELVKLTKPLKDGHPEKMDWATLLWYMVEHELLLGGQLVNCNYASHLQHLIRSQHEQLLSTEPVEVVMTQEAVSGLHESEPDELILMEESKIEETCVEVQEKKDNGCEEEALEEKGQDIEEAVLKKKDDEGDVLETKDSVNEEVPDKKGDGKEEEVLEKKEDGDEEVLKKDQDKDEEVLETNDDLKEEVVEKNDDGKEEEVLEIKDDGKEGEVLEKKDYGKEDVVLEKKNDGKEEEVQETKDDGKEGEVLEKKDYGKEDVVLEKKNDGKEEEVQETKDDGEEEEVLEKSDYCNEVTTKADELGKACEEENNVMRGPRVELTSGQEFTIGDVPEEHMVDFEEFKYDHIEQDKRQWLLNGNNSVGEHFLQRCSVRDNMGSDGIEVKMEEVDDMEEEVEVEDGFDFVPTADDLECEGLAGNFQGAMAADKFAYGSQGPLSGQPSGKFMDSQNELEHMDASGPSFYVGNGKRKIYDDVDVSLHVLNSDIKRLKTQDSLDHQPADFFGTCMDEIQLLMDKGKTLYMEKVQNEEQSNMHQQILLSELQERDGVIKRLDQMKQEEIRKKDAEIYRLNQELFLMCSLLEDYKKAIKQTDKAFSEYRLQYQLLEEPIYKDAGPGGLVLSITDIEKRRQKEEEEFIVKCLEIEQKAKQAEEAYTFQFGEFQDKVDRLDKRLSVLESGFRSLKDSSSTPNVSGARGLAANV